MRRRAVTGTDVLRLPDCSDARRHSTMLHDLLRHSTTAPLPTTCESTKGGRRKGAVRAGLKSAVASRSTCATVTQGRFLARPPVHPDLVPSFPRGPHLFSSRP